MAPRFESSLLFPFLDVAGHAALAAARRAAFPGRHNSVFVWTPGAPLPAVAADFREAVALHVVAAPGRDLPAGGLCCGGNYSPVATCHAEAAAMPGSRDWIRLLAVAGARDLDVRLGLPASTALLGASLARLALAVAVADDGEREVHVHVGEGPGAPLDVPAVASVVKAALWALQERRDLDDERCLRHSFSLFLHVGGRPAWHGRYGGLHGDAGDRDPAFAHWSALDLPWGLPL